MSLADLIVAVSSYIYDCGGAPTKTKVLKLLYLLDIEEYRQHKKTLTGFEWVFYLFGPWAASYDAALSSAAAANRIRIVQPQGSDEGATFINSIEQLPLASVFPIFVQELRAKRIIEAWATRPTVDLLDYVYFHTAPMQDAERNAVLDFSKLDNEKRLTEYRGLKLNTDENELKRKRREFQERMKSVQRQPIAPLDPLPEYDELYRSALAKLESDD